MVEQLVTQRLTLRPWRIDDADAALRIFGEAEVARWLQPATDTVPDVEAMRLLLQQWINDDSRLTTPAGRWAIERRDDEQLIGGVVLLPLPPDDEDLELGFQLRPDTWGHGYAAEAGHGVAAWAFQQGLDEIFAVARPRNVRAAATARRIGMEWVGETDKYYGLHLDVFRIRPGDLDPQR